MYKLLRSFGIGEPQDDTDTLRRSLSASDVPVSTADCRSCADPCDLGHESYPRRFDIDMSDMIGSVKPYRRQVVISTGKADWDSDILHQKDSLAALLSRVTSNPPAKHLPVPLSSEPPSTSPSKSSREATGVFASSDATRISILNGNHHSMSHGDDHETVLVFPDFKCVSEVPRTSQGAIDLWHAALDPSLGQNDHSSRKELETELKTWVIPHACVILLCSHKKRDNRCGISAPLLENEFIKALEAKGWDTDTHLAHPSGPALEDLEKTSPEDWERILADQMRENAASKRVLIVKVSHFGGHKYGGNAVIYTPSGSGIWYGRVTPHEVDSIVENTIIDGLVLPPLLRGGVNLSRPNCTTLNDW